MNVEFAHAYRQLEARHWWFMGRRQIIGSLVSNIPDFRTKQILEVGCSTGLLLNDLSKMGCRKLTGVDIDIDAIKLARHHPTIKMQAMDAQTLSYPTESFDIVIASDILEHIRDDARAMKEIARVLRPRGLLILFVPAFMFLWSYHDVANMHFRRYSHSGILKLITGSGFAIERICYWNLCSFFPAIVFRLCKSIFSSRRYEVGDLKEVSYPVNCFLRTVLGYESRIMLKGINLPFGMSLMCIAEKKKGSSKNQNYLSTL